MYETTWTARIKLEDGETFVVRNRVRGDAKEARKAIRAGIARDYPGMRFSVTQLRELVFELI